MTARLLGRVPLRVRLVVLVVCLASGAIAAVSLAGAWVTRGSLLRQTDRDLRAAAGRIVSQSFVAGPGPVTVPVGVGRGGLSLEVLGPGGSWLLPLAPGWHGGPAIPARRTWISAHAGHPVTVASRDGGERWRAIAEPIRYRARRVLFAYGATDVTVAVSSSAGSGLPGILVVAASMSGVTAAVGRMAVTDLAVGGVTILLVAGLAAALTWSCLRPLGRLEQRVRSAAAGRRGLLAAGRAAVAGAGGHAPGGPGAVDHGSEIGAIARAVGTVLGNAEQAFRVRMASEVAASESQQRIRYRLADVGQELRTRLSVITGIAESCRRRGQFGPGEADRMVRRLEREAARMQAAADALGMAATLSAPWAQDEQDHDADPAAQPGRPPLS